MGAKQRGKRKAKTMKSTALSVRSTLTPERAYWESRDTALWICFLSYKRKMRLADTEVLHGPESQVHTQDTFAYEPMWSP